MSGTGLPAGVRALPLRTRRKRRRAPLVVFGGGALASGSGGILLFTGASSSSDVVQVTGSVVGTCLLALGLALLAGGCWGIRRARSANGRAPGTTPTSRGRPGTRGSRPPGAPRLSLVSAQRGQTPRGAGGSTADPNVAG